MRAVIESSSSPEITVVRRPDAIEQLHARGETLQFPERIASEPHSTEPFVDAGRAADFVKLNRKTILRLAREGSIPAHPLAGKKRRMWRFLVSELDAWGRGKVNSGCDRCQNSRSK